MGLFCGVCGAHAIYCVSGVPRALGVCVERMQYVEYYFSIVVFREIRTPGERNLSQCHFAQNKSDTNRPKINPGAPKPGADEYPL